jgi:predicted nucleotidyltransferase
MNIYTKMIATVAKALGEGLLQEVAFVGGCTTGLLLTDDFSKEQVRHTDDVDLIVHVVNHAGMLRLQAQLSARGFSHSMEDDSPICSMKLGELRVDFMPDDESVLGFSNRWYVQALKTATPYQLPDGQFIRLVTPAYFVATKLEAYRGRGNNDPLGSRDIEDILTLVDGRSELAGELLMAPAELRQYISAELTNLLKVNQFSYAVTSAAGNEEGREDLIFERLESIIQGAT